MASFLLASAVVMADDSGLFGEHPALESTADAIRGVGSGELSGGFDELDDFVDSARRIAGSFNEVADALG